MSVSFVGAGAKFKKSEEDARHGGGGNPDDQSHRHHIGDPKDKPEDEIKTKQWKDSEGRVSGWEVKKVRARLLSKHGFSRKKVAIVDAVVHNAIDEKGGQKGMNYGELNETMETLGENASKLGLSKNDLGDIRLELEEKL